MSNSAWSCRSSGSAPSQRRRRAMFPKSEKEFLQDFYIRRRENSARQAQFWSATSTYFNKAERDAKKWDRLEVCSQVAEKTYRESQRRESQKAQLRVRRERLKRLLASEAVAYEEELKSLPRCGGSIQGLRDEREVFRAKREEEARNDAKRKMEQHWKINNPEFRELSMRKHRDIVVEAWKRQSEEKERMEEEKARCERAEHAAAEANRLQAEQDFADKEREKEERVREWKSFLLEQSQALRDRRRDEEDLDFRISLELIKKDELKGLREEMRKREEIRQKKELGNYLRRQSRLKLRVKAQQIQDELEEDRRFLEKLRFLEEKEECARESSQARIMEDIQWMNAVLTDQKAEEARREKELDLMFSEDASKMWHRQEQVWAKEKAARDRLIEDVMTSVEEQLELKLKERRLLKDRNTQEQVELEREIESMEACISQEEAERRAKQVTYAKELSEQIQARVPPSPPPSPHPGEQTLNQLSHRLEQFNIKPQESDVSHFRRRRTKW